MSTFISRLRSLMRNLRGKGVTDVELDEELNAYVTALAAEKTKRGMSADAARRSALLEVGGMEVVKEQVREARSGYYVGAFMTDIRYTMRMLARNPGYTVAIVLTLALGIGATTAIFTVVRAVLLRQLPYEDPDRIVRVWPSNPSHEIPHGTISVPELADWRSESKVFTSVAGYNGTITGLALVGGGEPVRLNTAYVSEDFFKTLGVLALYGRTISPAEHADGANHVVVISYELWKSRYGGDHSIVGRTVQLNEQPFTVVGVMPPSMRFPSATIQAWTPTSVIGPDAIPRIRFARWLQMVGRLQPGVTMEEAQKRLGVVARRIEKDNPESNAGWSASAITQLRDDIVGPARGRLLVIFGTVLLILLLGCVNIANLVLARATQRKRELAVRAALGASRSRLVRQLLTESIALSLIGGALGVALAWWGSSTLASMSADWLPLPDNVHPDWLVLGFALLICVATGVAFGLIPAAADFSGLSGVLREGGRSSSPGARAHAMRRVFVAAELALAVVLVAGAALFVQSFAKLSRVNPGFDVDHTAYARVTLPDRAFHSLAEVNIPGQKMLESIRTMPGVTAAGTIKEPPLRGEGEPAGVGVPGQVYAAGTQPIASALPVSPGFFGAIGMTLRAGRDFTDQDAAGGAVIVSESVAHTLWGDRDPVGQNILIGTHPLPVVGVVGDVKYATMEGAATPTIYVTRNVMPRSVITFVVRGKGDPAQLLTSLRNGIRAIDPDQPITELATMRDAVDQAIAAPRFLTFLLTLFGVLALLLAGIGVYGVVSYVVGQRTNEIGIRMALGARASGIVGWTLRTGMTPVAAGLAGGVAGALVLSRLVRSQLYAVSANSLGTYAGVVLLLAAISLAAIAVPALRATRIDPTTALRSE